MAKISQKQGVGCFFSFCVFFISSALHFLGGCSDCYMSLLWEKVNNVACAMRTHTGWMNQMKFSK